MNRRERLLLVDDDESSLEMLARRLIRLGFEVETASDGTTALDRIESGSFDLILLDRSMPEVSGMDVLRRIRTTYNRTQLPVIMVTAEAQGEALAEALDAGADDYVTKPVDLSVVHARIRSQLDRRRSEQLLEQSEERYARAAEAADEVVIDWSLDTNEMYASPRWNQMLGLAAGEKVQHANDWLDRVHPQDLIRLNQSLAAYTNATAAAAGTLEFEHRLRHADGTYRWVKSRCRAIYSQHGRPCRIAGALTDITAAKFADPLTGLPNRSYLLDQLSQAMERAGLHGTPLAVLFCDLDGFKYVNDSFGHTVGDELLAAVAARLESALGAETGPGRALITRLGGDEFAVMVEGLGDGTAEAGQILEALRAPIRTSAHQVYVSVSIGIAVYSAGCVTTIEMLRDADTAMYRAKSAGKNQFAIFTEEMREQAVRQLALGNAVRHALLKREFTLAFQPIICLATGRLASLEALLRWPSRNSPSEGIDPVIRAAEEAGLMTELGQWVLEEACQRFAIARNRGNLSGVNLNVNVSALQFATGNLCDQVVQTLNLIGLDPSLVNLELTESALITNMDAVVAACGRLKKYGVRLSIDDFGTGYSSLSYLRQIPFDTVKLDRSFLRDLEGGNGDLKHGNAEIVRAVIQLAHAFQMEVVGEGVECPSAVRTLRDLGCEYGQGFYFARPMPLEEAIEFAHSRQLVTKGF